MGERKTVGELWHGLGFEQVKDEELGAVVRAYIERAVRENDSVAAEVLEDLMEIHAVRVSGQ